MSRKFIDSAWKTLHSLLDSNALADIHKEGTQIPEVDFFYRCPSLTGKPGRLQSMGSQRVGHDLTKEQQQLPFEVLENGGDLVICTFWFVCVCVFDLQHSSLFLAHSTCPLYMAVDPHCLHSSEDSEYTPPPSY